MASLRKQKSSRIWYAQFYVPDPETGELRQVRKSTGTANKSKAKAVATEMERAAHGVVKAGSDDMVKAKAILAEAVAELEQERFTALSARRHLARLLAIATGEEMQEFTIASWSVEWLRRKERDSSKATMARYRGHVKSLLTWLGEKRSEKPLESITSTEARKWREHLQDEGRAGKTVLAYTKDAGGLYRAAIREGLVTFNPFAALEAIDTSDSLDRKPFTGDEVGKLIQAAPSEEWRGLILTAAFTGLRLGDASRLSWDSVDLETKTITLIPSKTKKKKREVRIPIQAELLTYLLAAPVAEDAPSAHVFPTLAKLTVGQRGGLSRTFIAIMEAAKVDRGKASRTVVEGEKFKGNVTFERGFHSLRHTFTSWLRSAGVSEEDRMALTGHTTRESHQIYSHTDEQALRDAIEKLTLKTQ